MSYAADAANVLFRVVSQRHLRRRPVVVTTNEPLAALGQVLHGGDLAEAILDRLLERGTHFVLRGRSYRTRQLKEETRTEAAEDAAWLSLAATKFREKPRQNSENPTVVQGLVCLHAQQNVMKAITCAIRIRISAARRP